MIMTQGIISGGKSDGSLRHLAAPSIADRILTKDGQHFTIVELIKDEYGFGFNVVGGSDSEHIPGESGIFISSIKEEGVAHKDGRLQQGDKLISINGIDLTCLPHGEAVNILRRVEEKATILVQHEAELTALEHTPTMSRHRNEGLGPRTTNERASTSKDLLESRSEEDEDSLYAPSVSNSIVDDVPRTPRKEKTTWEKSFPIMSELAFFFIGVGAIAASAYLTYKFVAKKQH